jgi:hypothetical protein
VDPSSFNMNRMGNANKAEEDWKQGKRKGPRSPWGPIIVLLILVAVIIYFIVNSQHH